MTIKKVFGCGPHTLDLCKQDLAVPYLRKAQYSRLAKNNHQLI